MVRALPDDGCRGWSGAVYGPVQSGNGGVVVHRWALGSAGYWSAVAVVWGFGVEAVGPSPAQVAEASDTDDLIAFAMAQVAAAGYAVLSFLVALVWLVAWLRRGKGSRWAWAAALLSAGVVVLMFPAFAMVRAGWGLLPMLLALVMPVLGIRAAARSDGRSDLTAATA